MLVISLLIWILDCYYIEQVQSTTSRLDGCRLGRKCRRSQVYIRLCVLTRERHDRMEQQKAVDNCVVEHRGRVSRSSCCDMRSHMAQKASQGSASGGVWSDDDLPWQPQQHPTCKKPRLLCLEQAHWGKLPLFPRACPFRWSRTSVCSDGSTDCWYLHQTPGPRLDATLFEGRLVYGISTCRNWGREVAKGVEETRKPSRMKSSILGWLRKRKKITGGATKGASRSQPNKEEENPRGVERLGPKRGLT